MSVRVRLTDWLHQQWQKKGWFSLVMRPLSALAVIFVQRKQHRYEQDPSASYRSPVPVIVVGNIIVGGAGKTPVVLALTEQLRALGWAPGIVSRGYGVEIGPNPRVGQGQLAAEQFGDEPALIAAQTQAPIAVHPRRALAAQALLKDFPAALHDGLVLITRKDAVKCQHLNDSRLWVVDVQPEFSRPDWIAELDSLLRKRRLTSPSLSGVQ
uniref:tetraacyldisaccharide 4'-kinase n=1 Tax=Steinernema glaseri TaxID=37863 RepID=A0A1I7Y8F0_9BILA